MERPRHTAPRFVWHARVACGLIACAVSVAACAPGQAPPHAGFVDEPVAAVAAQASGQIAAVPVHEGDRVEKGQLIAQIEASDRQAAVAVAEANVERAKQALKEAHANLRAAMPAVRGAGAEIRRAEATLDEAQTSYDRAQRLLQSGAVTQADVDSARARLLEARAAVESMTAAKAQSQGKLSASFAAVDDAQAAVQSAQAQLQVAQVRLAQTRVLSPFDGMVVSRNLEPGEWAAPGTPVVTVEDTSHPWVRLDVAETEFRGLAIGQHAKVRVIALGAERFSARVTQIGAEGDFAINRDVKRGRPDVRTFMVRVAFDHPSAKLRPGMTAEVWLVGGGSGSSSRASSGRAER